MTKFIVTKKIVSSVVEQARMGISIDELWSYLESQKTHPS